MASRTHKKLLVVQAAALGYDLLAALPDGPNWAGLHFAPMRTVFPAVTCTVQASFRTATRPGAHGMVANGRFSPQLRKILFWEQSAGLVDGERIWDGYRASGGRVGMLFWQQSLGEDIDCVLSPAPIHKHHGGMIESFYAQPRNLHERLTKNVGRAFRLRHYWGPLASARAGDWIAEATASLLDGEDAPELVLTYLPTLDYDLQRYGPDSKQASRALTLAEKQVRKLLEAAQRRDYAFLVFGDYAIAPAERVAWPNRALVEEGLMAVRSVHGMWYPDLYASAAVAMVDHEIAHVFVRDPSDIERTAHVLGDLPGVAEVLDPLAQEAVGLDHPGSGQLVLLAEQGTWLAYPWWDKPQQAPDYARHVDIHNKPGFDPCELFFGWPPGSISLDATRVRGTHGRAGGERKVAWATTADLPTNTPNLIALAETVRQWLA